MSVKIETIAEYKLMYNEVLPTDSIRRFHCFINVETNRLNIQLEEFIPEAIRSN
jgi:hypothetical protein